MRQTKEYDFETRAEHPHPCPLLEDDVCSIYDPDQRYVDLLLQLTPTFVPALTTTSRMKMCQRR